MQRQNTKKGLVKRTTLVENPSIHNTNTMNAKLTLVVYVSVTFLPRLNRFR